MGRLHSWWQQIKQHLYTTGSVALLALILFILSAYRFGWDWTGFNSGTSQITIISSSKVNYIATVSQPSKFLWDWLGLLAAFAIPVVVGFGAVWYTARQSHDLEIMLDNQRETALQTFIDKIPEYKLRESSSLAGTKEQIILRARTLALLPSLDANRKRTVLQFLYELKLISRKTVHQEGYPIIELSYADLSGANLANLNLENADLAQSNLSGANLRDAVLIKANLQGTILDNAELSRANLSGANLTGALLERANLKGVTGITDEELKKQAKSLKGATMPDGSIHP